MKLPNKVHMLRFFLRALGPTWSPHPRAHPACAAEPNFYTKNHYYLGLTLARLQRKEEAKM